MKNLYITTSVLALLFGQPVKAQEDLDAADMEEMIVTGTKIKGLDLEGASQAFQIDREQIIENGNLQVIDVLRDLTITGGGTGTFSTSTAGALSGDTPPGASGVSLRGLGTSSTLTLINGRRTTVSAFANGQESFFDVNSIPAAAIERIEVLPNGASALYGADAVAGVVNFILRRDFEGQEISASYGNSTAGTDEARINVNGIIGRQFGDHSLMLVVDYFQRNPLFNRDRDFTLNNLDPSQQGFFPSFFDGFFQEFDQTEEPQDGGCPEEDFGFGTFGEFCAVNNNEFTSTRDKLDQIGGLFAYSWQIDSKTLWSTDFVYQNTESAGTSSPAFFNGTPVDPENPFFPEALIEDIVEEGQNNDPMPFDFIDFFGFPIDAFGRITEPRAVEVDSQSFRLTSFISRDVGETWNLEAGFVFGGNGRTQRGTSGLVLSEPFINANLGNLCSDGTLVDRWEVDFDSLAADFIGNTCEDDGRTTLWYNPFGGQVEQLDGIAEAIETTAERNGRSRLYIGDFNATGDLFSWFGGTIKGAFGGEFRRETLTDVPAGEAVATSENPNPILGFSSTSADIDRNQFAFYGELYIPITEYFDLQVAGRYDDFQGFGGDFNPKIAGRFQPIEQVIIRGTWSTAFRAPSLAQAGAGTLLSSFSVDCFELPEACAGMADASGAGLLSEDVGNVALGPENAESWSVGVLLRPFRNFEINFDLFDIRQEGLVGINEEDFIRQALGGAFPVIDTATDSLPSGVPGIEVTDGFVTDAHFQITNLGFQETRGFDATLFYDFDIDGVGSFDFTFNSTYLIEFNEQPSDVASFERLAGDFQFPRFLANARFGWRKGPYRVSIAGFYTSGYEDDPDVDALEALGLAFDDTRRVDDWLIWDLNLSYDFAKNSFFQISIQNITNEDPPLVAGRSTNVDQINHNSLGRFIQARVNFAF